MSVAFTLAFPCIREEKVKGLTNALECIKELGLEDNPDIGFTYDTDVSLAESKDQQRWLVQFPRVRLMFRSIPNIAHAINPLTVWDRDSLIVFPKLPIIARLLSHWLDPRQLDEENLTIIRCPSGKFETEASFDYLDGVVYYTLPSPTSASTITDFELVSRLLHDHAALDNCEITWIKKREFGQDRAAETPVWFTFRHKQCMYTGEWDPHKGLLRYRLKGQSHRLMRRWRIVYVRLHNN